MLKYIGINCASSPGTGGTPWFTRSASGQSSSLTLPSFEVSHSEGAYMKSDMDDSAKVKT